MRDDIRQRTMKKHVITLMLLLLTIVAFSQTNYDKGFQNGYKEGYCYNDFGCISPIPPITPIPYIGESNNNYQDGYNRGFKTGTEDKQRNNTKSSGNGNYNAGGNNPWPVVAPAQIPQRTYNPPPQNSPFTNADAEKQALYSQNKDYRDKLIEWISDLKTKTNDKEFLTLMDKYYQQLRVMDGQNFDELGNRLNIIKQNVVSEIDKCNKRAEEAPKKLWDSGNENIKKGKYSEAIQDYTNFIQLRPEFVYVYRERGMAYQYQGKYTFALTDLNKYIELQSSNDPIAYNARAWTKFYVNDNLGALADFNKLIELDPSSAYAYYNRGFVKSKLNDKYGAILDYTKAIELNPIFSMAYNNRGWARYELKKYSEALKDINKSIELEPTNWVAFDSRQETKFMLNDYKGCIQDCDQAILLNPKVSNSFFFRGRAYYRQGNKSKACEDWSKAGELGKSEAYNYIIKYCNN